MRLKIYLSLKLALFFLTILSFSNCAYFSYKFQNPTFLTPDFLVPKNVKELNGEYSIIARTKDSTYDRTFKKNNNFFQVLNRKRNKKDTLNIDSLENYSFKIDVMDQKNIKILYLKKNIVFNELIIKYELRGGYLFLENKNTLIGGIPFIFGGIDIVKVRLTRDLKKNLVAEIVNKNLGGLLLVFSQSKTYYDQWYYHRK